MPALMSGLPFLNLELVMQIVRIPARWYQCGSRYLGLNSRRSDPAPLIPQEPTANIITTASSPRDRRAPTANNRSPKSTNVSAALRNSAPRTCSVGGLSAPYAFAGKELVLGVPSRVRLASACRLWRRRAEICWLPIWPWETMKRPFEACGTVAARRWAVAMSCGLI